MRIKKDHCVNNVLKEDLKLKFPAHIVRDTDLFNTFKNDWSAIISKPYKRYVVSMPLLDRFFDAYDAIKSAFDSDRTTWVDPIDEIYVINDKFFLIHVEMFEGFPRGWVLAFSGKNNIDVWRYFQYLDGDSSTLWFNGFDLYEELGKSETVETMWMLLFSLFIKYAEIETKNLPPKSKVKAFNCRYSNLTKEKFTILDSTWLTTLVKSDGFNVRGHFRMQPCGEGRKDRKLIWVDEFMKSGYNRQAGLLKQQKEER